MFTQNIWNCGSQRINNSGVYRRRNGAQRGAQLKATRKSAIGTDLAYGLASSRKTKARADGAENMDKMRDHMALISISICQQCVLDSNSDLRQSEAAVSRDCYEAQARPEHTSLQQRADSIGDYHQGVDASWPQ